MLFHNLLLLRYPCIVSSAWDSLSKLLVVGSIFKNMNQSLWMNIILLNWGKRQDFSKKNANNENNKWRKHSCLKYVTLKMLHYKKWDAKMWDWLVSSAFSKLNLVTIHLFGCDIVLWRIKKLLDCIKYVSRFFIMINCRLLLVF